MSHLEILAWSAAAGGGALALLVAGQARSAPAARWFAAGMLVLAAGSVCFGLTVTAVSPGEMVYWQMWRLIVGSLLPGIWLLFSLVYARGNAREFLRQWRFPLLAAFVLPVGLALGFRDHLIAAAGQATAGAPWMFRLSPAGSLLNLCFLLGAVLGLMNLERTYRAAVGTMRWRIKFMVLGLGVIFTVQAYVTSQVLLFHNTLSLPLQSVTAMALLVGCLLILRSLFRRGAF